MTDALVAFLQARLDEDEQAARAATERQPYDEWDAVGAGDDSDTRLSHWEVVKIARPHPTPAAKSIAEHIACHDPARVLAEVEAKRRLLDWLSGRDEWALDNNLWSWDSDDALCLLALPYADHPDYREEWRP